MKIKDLKNELEAHSRELAELRAVLAKHESKRPELGQLSANWETWRDLRDQLAAAVDRLATEAGKMQAAADRTDQAQVIAGKMGARLEDALIHEPPSDQARRDLAAHMAARLGWNLSPEQKTAITAEYESEKLL